jgi:inosine-uridine nucleoside N-ribohydrolase
MGGAIACEGNATPTAEFNFWFDPDAAEELMASELPITLLPLDVVRGMHYAEDFGSALRPNHLLAEYVHGSVAKPGTLTVCDEVLAAIAMDPQLVSRHEVLKLSVETRPGARYGAVSVLAKTADRRSVEVIERINTSEFWRLTREALLST